MSTASLLFTVEDREGSLEEVLKIFKNSPFLCRIESRPSKVSNGNMILLLISMLLMVQD